jgi:DNA-binding winged helix-turn-helix (wHTH) protein
VASFFTGERFLRFGEFELDPASRQLRCSGRPLHLSPKAFALLEMLLQRRPAALSKADIRDRVWPRTFVSDSNLTSLVTELRTALGDDAREPRFVRTVYGFGYAFCGEVAEREGGRPPAGDRCRLYYDGREIALPEGEITLGRADDVAALIDAASVSRRHARIRVREGRATLEDLGSKNGTFVGGERLLAPRELKDGDEIRLGHIPLTFRILGTAASTRTDTRTRR